MDYIEICEWERFQHYKKRNPPWVKLYSACLDDDDFDFLPDESKLFFFCLLPFASRRNNKMKCDFKWLQKKLPISKRITQKTLQPLLDVGFIKQCTNASGMLAECTHNATPEAEAIQEAEKERETKQRKETTDCSKDSGFASGLGLQKRALWISEMIDDAFKPFTDDETTTFLRASKYLAGREAVTNVLLKGFIDRSKAVGVKNPKGLFIKIIKDEVGFKGLGKLI